MRDEYKFVIKTAAIIIAITTLIAGLIGFAIARNKYYEPELLSPLPDKTECVIFEIEIERNQNGKTFEEPGDSSKLLETYNQGEASFYDRSICKAHGTTYGVDCKTFNGDLFQDTAFTAACDISLLNSKVRVNYRDRSVEVICTDTGSFEEKYGRVIDLSKAAFVELAPVATGTIDVKIEKL